jgi:Zn-dependent protease with chaperone function
VAEVNQKSLAARSVLLVIGWAGFYVLGLALVAALVAVPYVQIAYGNGPGVSGMLCGLGALWVIWGLIPRSAGRSRVEEWTPLADPPGLRRLVQDVAQQVGHAPPALVHLTVHANAYAGRQRQRRLWRKGEQSTVGIGLPFLAWLDPAAVRAIVAHEMGHHVAGDVRLGPWVHRTRSAIGTALEHLDGSSFWLHMPFLLYGELFMRTSLGVSRAQELAADAVSARIAGADATARALALSNARGRYWEAYLQGEVIPMLEEGFLPELLSGFELFFAASSQKAPARTEEPTSELDTHPSLEERLAALGVASPDVTLGDSFELLEDVAQTEEAVLRDLLVDPKRKLERLRWSEAGEKVWLPRWRAVLEPHAGVLGRLRGWELDRVAADLDGWADRTRSALATSSPQAERRRLDALFGAWLSVRLADEGFRIEALPGAPVRAVRGDECLEPFELVKSLFAGTLSRAEWSAKCTRWAA